MVSATVLGLGGLTCCVAVFTNCLFTYSSKMIFRWVPVFFEEKQKGNFSCLSARISDVAEKTRLGMTRYAHAASRQERT